MARGEEKKFSFICNHCAVAVDERTHERHLKILDWIFKADTDGEADLFVHERGRPINFDADGVVVVCDRCLIVELSDNLILETN